MARGTNGPITLLLVTLTVITVFHSQPAASSKATTTVSFLAHLRTLADISDTMTRTMKSSPIFYVKKLLSTGSKLPSYNSPIYKLPLKLLSNAKPTGIVHGLVSSAATYKPAATSNIFKIPLKFVSNAKPTGLTVHNAHSFINHAVHSVNNVHKYPTMSNIIRLPLQFMSNAKPTGISVLQNQLLSMPSSNIYHLPLQFMSNAKPFGVNFNPFMF